MTDEVEHLFMSIDHLDILLVKCPFNSSLYFNRLVFFILISKTSLCILDMNPLLVLYIIFLHSMPSLFSFLIVSFDKQKVLILM